MKPLQQRAAELLAEGSSTRGVSETLGVSRATAWRYTQNPDVQTEVSRLQGASRRKARGRLHAMAGRAVDALGALLAAEDTPPRVRLAVALAVLDRVGLGEAEAGRKEADGEQKITVVLGGDVPRPPEPAAGDAETVEA